MTHPNAGPSTLPPLDEANGQIICAIHLPDWYTLAFPEYVCAGEHTCKRCGKRGIQEAAVTIHVGNRGRFGVEHCSPSTGGETGCDTSTVACEGRVSESGGRTFPVSFANGYPLRNR